jgi:phosphate acetyltransferase
MQTGDPAKHPHHAALLDRCRGLAPLTTAVVHPCDAISLEGAVIAGQAGLIVPILVGPARKVRAAAAAAGLDISALRLVDTPHSHAAAAEAAAMAARGEAKQIMKGALHTDELMHEALSAAAGLRTGRRASHVFVMDVPGFPRPLLITDAALNIRPTLADKADIVRNAIDVARAIGVSEPRVAILSAVETVEDKLPSTVDAAALCKMAERGQISGGLLDGPLAFDNAISAAAALEKGIVSEVAGRADILVAPDLEAGNMLVKQLSFMGGADAAGVVAGLRVPVVLTSRADSPESRLASCAVARLLAEAMRPVPA